MDLLLQLFGAAMVGVALLDVYLTVLFARSGTGLISPRLHGTVWVSLRTIASNVPGGRRWLLPHGGPLVLVANMVLWSALLVVGFALIVWPEMGSAIQASGGQPTPRTFGAALYFAGYSLTTLGTGDLVPRTDLFRILMFLQAGLGFSFLTLTLTYFTSVYSALVRRNRLALRLHHRTGDSGDAIELVARLLAGSDSAVREEFSEVEAGLDDLYESHHFYPVLHYFYFVDPHYALSRMLLVTLDAVTLVRCAVEEEKYHQLMRSSEIEGLWRSATSLLDRLGRVFLPRHQQTSRAATEEEMARWKTRYRRAVETLRAKGIPVTSDLDAGLERYSALRCQWNPGVLGFCRYEGRDWSEIALETAE